MARCQLAIKIHSLETKNIILLTVSSSVPLTVLLLFLKGVMKMVHRGKNIIESRHRQQKKKLPTTVHIYFSLSFLLKEDIVLFAGCNFKQILMTIFVRTNNLISISSENVSSISKTSSLLHYITNN